MNLYQVVEVEGTFEAFKESFEKELTENVEWAGVIRLAYWGEDHLNISLFEGIEKAELDHLLQDYKVSVSEIEVPQSLEK